MQHTVISVCLSAKNETKPGSRKLAGLSLPAPVFSLISTVLWHLECLLELELVEHIPS